MAIELSLPAKVGAGASAAAAGSLAIAGGAGAFNSNSLSTDQTLNDEGKSSGEETTINNNNKAKEGFSSLEPALLNQVTPESQEDSPVVSASDVKQEPSKPIKTIEQDTTNTYSDQTIGKAYAKYLVSVKSTAEDSNQNWWNNKFDEFQKRKDANKEVRESDNPFKEIPTSGFLETLDSSLTSLNAKCDATYKLTVDLSKLTKTSYSESSDDEEDEKSYVSTWEDLWRYCSEFRLSPVLLKNPSVGSGPSASTLGKKLENKVLSTSSYDNDNFWTYLDTEFFKQGEESIEDEYFKNFRKSTPDRAQEQSDVPLKKKCDEIYKIPENTTVGINAPSESAILKYCSLESK